MRFTNAYAACPICAPSRAAILTGKLPSNTGFVDNYISELDGKTLQRAEDRQFLDLEEVTLAEAFQSHGYQTGFVGKWHLTSNNETHLPTNQGFDVNIAGGWWGHPRGRTGFFSPWQMAHLEDGPKGEYLPDRLTTEAIRVMNGFAEEENPWLLYMSYYTVHAPFHSKPEKKEPYASRTRNPAYSGMVASLDENVGRLLDWLAQSGARDNTIVVFTSDNGGHVAASNIAPLRSYKGALYEGGIRVPCIIDWPGVIEPGSVSDAPIHGVDFYATLLAAAGLPPQPEDHEDSVNLVPLLNGKSPDFNRGPMVWHYPLGVPHIAHSHPGSVIRDGDWKYLRFYTDGREELYNLSDDIGETKNLAAAMPEKAAELKAQLDAVLKKHNAAIPAAVPPKPKRRAKKKGTAAQPATDQPINRSTAPQAPNIIFIMADDLGYADVSCYGAEKIQTPNIDRIAAEGIRFTDGHAGASTCTPTRYGFMTGRYNFRSWLKCSALSTSAPLLIDPDRVTVPSFLKSKGYATSIVGKWHLGYGSEPGFEDDRGDIPPNYWETRGPGPDWNGVLRPGTEENGFGYSYVIPVANSFPPYVIVENDRVEGLRKDSPIGALQSKNGGKMEGGEGARWTDEELIDKFAGKLESELDRLATNDAPFFLCYTSSHPHIGARRGSRRGHWPHERFAGTSQAGPFGDTVHELDWSVGVILEKLDELDIADDTLIIFTSDNGGYPRKFNDHYPMGPILRGGKGDLTEGGTRVPFVARWPGRIPAGAISKEIVSTTDMMATFAAVIDENLPEGAGPDSDNVLPAFLGKALPDPDRSIVFISGGTGALALRSGKWKLIEGQGDRGYGEMRQKKPVPNPGPGAPPHQLYNLDEDLGEANNLYLQHPEIAERMLKQLAKIRDADL
jgi:arylsulfatase A-like enzyme